MGTEIRMAARLTGQLLRFEDGSAELIISSGKVMLGNQTVTETETDIETPLDTSDHSFGLFSDYNGFGGLMSGMVK